MEIAPRMSLNRFVYFCNLKRVLFFSPTPTTPSSKGVSTERNPGVSVVGDEMHASLNAAVK